MLKNNYFLFLIIRAIKKIVKTFKAKLLIDLVRLEGKKITKYCVKLYIVLVEKYTSENLIDWPLI